MDGFYYSIASGSSGNCAVWRVGATSILLDLGVSVRALTTALRRLEMKIEDLSAVLLTHEHADHIKGLATFCKKYDVPIYASFGTSAAIQMKLPQAKRLLQPFAGGESFPVIWRCTRSPRRTMRRSRCATASTAADTGSPM